MKPTNLSLLPLLLTSVALAVPYNEFEALQTVLSDIPEYSELVGTMFDQAAKDIKKVAADSKKTILESSQVVETWAHGGRDFVKQHGLTYELLSHPSFTDYKIRVTEPSLCDPTVRQHSGYLDISDGKHLFFWFFESRIQPDKAPLILWINGGPGCSSSTGLLFELGPCNVANEGKNTTFNKHSWNSHANIIFLDQPVDVGYSYSSDGSTVNTSPVAGVDVYAFLELFLTRYPEYASAPLHLAAESYGGTYAPNIASVIHKKNRELALAPIPNLVTINLASVILANGQTDPYIQMASIPDFACDGPYAVYDDPNGPECTALRSKVPTCQRLIKACYDYGSRLTCVPAALYCQTQLYGGIQQLGRNPYDVRKSCDREKDGQLCYKQMGWIEIWMNDPSNKKALGVNPEQNFESCNMAVNQAFLMQGDSMHNSALLLPELIEDGIRLLVYAGNADFMCNFIGNEAWVLNLENQFQDEFTNSKKVPWVTMKSGKVAGVVRAAGGKGFSAGNLTFVEVHEAGHMVPYDQPEAALDLIVRWIMDVPLTLNASDLLFSSIHGSD